MATRGQTIERIRSPHSLLFKEEQLPVRYRKARKMRDARLLKEWLAPVMWLRQMPKERWEDF